MMKVTIHYFKPDSGKWYCDDEDVEWPADPNHYTGFKPFAEIVRMKDMFAVCLETPLGFPHARPAGCRAKSGRDLLSPLCVEAYRHEGPHKGILEWDGDTPLRFLEWE